MVGGDSEQKHLLRSTAVHMSMLAVLAIPVLILINLLLLPPMALSGGLFALAGASIVVVFLAGIFVYAYRRDDETRYTAYALYALLVGLTLLFTSDQVAIATATQDHAVRLAAIHARKTEELKARLGVGAKALTGQEIYDGKCSACHLFDQKKVGPPYKEVIPKYEGKKDALVAFILNPVKMNPAYPSMPGQGLKPAEADSIATFLLAKYAPATSPAAGTAPSTDGMK